MQVGIIDADLLDNGTRFPNLALLKLSGYHKELGDNIYLLEDYKNIEEYDKIYVGKVFTKTKIPLEVFDHKHCTFGGSGFGDNNIDLKYDIEHHMPDYSLYDTFIKNQIQNGKKESNFKNYRVASIGFTTRGCFRKCDFCINKKYDKVFLHSHVSEFLDVNRKVICLLDDNFLGFHDWEKILDEIELTNKRFQFKQGLDIRLMDIKKAQRFAESKYFEDFIFSFDDYEDRDIIEEKLKLWRNYTHRESKIYLLCAYKSQDLSDIVEIFERLKIINKYKCAPYVMKYEKYEDSKYRDLYVQISRWCNQVSMYKKKSFREYCYLSQKYDCHTSNLGMSMRTMLAFEKEHPDIAKKYFDMKYEDQL